MAMYSPTEPKPNSLGECSDWSERSLRHTGAKTKGDHQVTLFNLGATDGGLDLRTIKVGGKNAAFKKCRNMKGIES